MAVKTKVAKYSVESLRKAAESTRSNLAFDNLLHHNEALGKTPTYSSLMKTAKRIRMDKEFAAICAQAELESTHEQSVS